MNRARTIIILRSVIAGLLMCLAVASFVGGRPAIGALFLLLAAANVALTVTMHRRSTEFAQRFPGLAQRGETPAPPTS
jgi:hypothetical protein